MQVHGTEYGRRLALVQEDEAGHTKTLATADQLLERMRGLTAQR